MRPAFAVPATRSARYLRNARVAFLAAGLALVLASCGSRYARQLADTSVRPPPGDSVVYVVNIPPGLIPVDVAHHRTSRPIALPSDATGVDVTSDRGTRTSAWELLSFPSTCALVLAASQSPCPRVGQPMP